MFSGLYQAVIPYFCLKNFQNQGVGGRATFTSNGKTVFCKDNTAEFCLKALANIKGINELRKCKEYRNFS